MKKRTQRIIISLVLVIALASICLYKFDSDSQKFFKMRSSIPLNGGAYFMENYGEPNEFSNLLIKVYFSYYKSQFKERFVEQKEGFEPISESQILNDIAVMYRNYWAQGFMKAKGDTKDYNLAFAKKMGSYLVENNLSSMPKDSIKSFKDIKPDLAKAIQKQGAYCNFFYLNDTYDIIIWTTQDQRDYDITTPSYGTKNLPVIFISDIILNNRRSFITFGRQGTGGWPKADKKVL